MDIKVLFGFEAAILLIAVNFALKPRLEFLAFRRRLPRRKYRVGLWIQTDPEAEPLLGAVAESLRQQGIEPISLHEQAASELYRNTRWRERIAWIGGHRVDIVVVGRQRSQATNSIACPYSWILDFRYFHPQNGAPLNGKHLATYTSGEPGALRALAQKTASEVVKALWLLKSCPVPPDPAYGYDTTSWPYTQSMDIDSEAAFPQRPPAADVARAPASACEKKGIRSPVLQMAAGLTVLACLLGAAADFAYSYFLLNRVEARVRAGAGYASSRACDAKDTGSFVSAVRNVVVYGDPEGGSSPLVPGLSPRNIVVELDPAKPDRTPPVAVAVAISGFRIGTIKSFELSNNPRVKVPYSGHYTPSR